MGEERVESYRDLIVWQRGMDLAESVYDVARAFSRDELFGLTSQARHAAASIPANIAKGMAVGQGRPMQVSSASLAARSRNLRRIFCLPQDLA